MQVTHGTCAFVTGASGRLGRAVAEALAARGATVGLAARSTAALEALAAALPGRHHVLPCDVTDAAAVAAAVGALAERAGRLDLVVCCAGAGLSGPPPLPGRSFEQALRAGAAVWPGTLFTVEAALGALRADGDGRIVVVVCGAVGGAVDAAARAAQRTFAEALPAELEGSGVGVTVVMTRARVADPHALAARVVEAVDYDEPAVRPPWAMRAAVSSCLPWSRKTRHASS